MTSTDLYWYRNKM